MRRVKTALKKRDIVVGKPFPTTISIYPVHRTLGGISKIPMIIALPFNFLLNSSLLQGIYELP
jgi:hypothetical protein